MLETGTIVVLVIVFGLFATVGVLLKMNLSKPEAPEEDKK